MSGECTGNVDPMHESAAKECAEGIGVIGENDLDHLRLAVTNRAGGKGCLFHSSFKDASPAQELSSSELLTQIAHLELTGSQ